MHSGAGGIIQGISEELGEADIQKIFLLGVSVSAIFVTFFEAQNPTV